MAIRSRPRRDEHPALPGQSDAKATDGFSVGDHDDGRAGPRRMIPDEGEQPVERATRQRPIHQDEPALPHVAAQVVDAAGGSGHVMVGALVDGRPGRSDRGVQRCGVLETVVADARRVERHGLRRDPDAVELNLARPRVDGNLGRQIASEVGGVGRVTGQADRADLFEVNQPRSAIVVQSHGDELRIGRPGGRLLPM